MQNTSSIDLAPRNLLRIARAAVGVAAGLVCYRLSGNTPDFAYRGMVRLFTLTRGYSNDLMSRWIGWFRRPYRLDSAAGILGLDDPARMREAVHSLRENGYVVFEEQLPAELCDKLLQFALTHPCQPRARDGGQGAGAPMTVYPRQKPDAIIYDFLPADLINQPDVQRLMSDRSFIALAQEYLGAQPVLDTVNLWWTTAFSRQPDQAAAQLYHFDMDHVRWLKVFIYLTDMTPTSGPHCFVAGSHRTQGIPVNLLDRGYVRLTDADVSMNFPPQKAMEFHGRAGTIIVEDTRGLHKGRPVLENDRLMFELEFSNSLFGAVLPNRGKIARYHDAAFGQFVKAHRRIFKRWLSPAAR